MRNGSVTILAEREKTEGPNLSKGRAMNRQIPIGQQAG